MASLRGSEVVHVPNNAALGSGTFRPGITPGPPSFQRAAIGPLAGPLGEVLGGIVGGLAGGAIAEGLGDDRPGEAQASPGQGACVQHLHVTCGERAHPTDDYGDGYEPELLCTCDEDGLSY